MHPTIAPQGSVGELSLPEEGIRFDGRHELSLSRAAPTGPQPSRRPFHGSPPLDEIRPLLKSRSSMASSLPGLMRPLRIFQSVTRWTASRIACAALPSSRSTNSRMRPERDDAGSKRYL
jgi:hypothetical protein